jgi:hypothetical protein
MCSIAWQVEPTLFRKAFHIVGDDDVRWVGLAYAFQVFETTSQLGARKLATGGQVLGLFLEDGRR